jgi:hypothetical protein
MEILIKNKTFGVFLDVPTLTIIVAALSCQAFELSNLISKLHYNLSKKVKPKQCTDISIFCDTFGTLLAFRLPSISTIFGTAVIHLLQLFYYYYRCYLFILYVAGF